MVCTVTRRHKIGDKVEFALPIAHNDFKDIGVCFAGVINKVYNAIALEVAAETRTAGTRFVRITIDQVIKNNTIEDEDREALREKRKADAFARATTVPPSEVEYVLYGDEIMHIDTAVQHLDDEESVPEYLYVAKKYPLRIRMKEAVCDYTSDWDRQFEECQPPEWNGVEEFQAAIDTFAKAAKDFEKANSEWFGLTVDRTKKVAVFELFRDDISDGQVA